MPDIPIGCTDVQTTFFAGMEAQLIGAAAPTGDGPVDKITQTANAAIVGSLVVHSYAGMYGLFLPSISAVSPLI